MGIQQIPLAGTSVSLQGQAFRACDGGDDSPRLCSPAAEFLAAAVSGNVAAVQKYLTHAGDVNARDDQGRTATMLAALYGHEDVLRVLLTAGAERDTCDARGISATDYMHAFGRLSDDRKRRARVIYLKLLMKQVGRSRQS